MKHIGFIDYYLDEWHANNYPDMIRKNSAQHNRNMDVGYAWALTDRENGLSTKEWCNRYNVTQAGSIEELVGKCDYIIILSPDDPDRHEQLAKIPLMSGKPVYIDKTFSHDYKSACRIFDHAKKHDTPVFSSSALRFSSEFLGYPDDTVSPNTIESVSVTGPGEFSNYAIHQIEMIVTLMGPEAKRTKSLSMQNRRHLIIDFSNNRRAYMHQMKGLPFSCALQLKNGDSKLITECSDFFPNFINSMLDFFETGLPPVPKEETLEVIAIIEAGNKALIKHDEWINILS